MPSARAGRARQGRRLDQFSFMDSIISVLCSALLTGLEKMKPTGSWRRWGRGVGVGEKCPDRGGMGEGRDKGVRPEEEKKWCKADSGRCSRAGRMGVYHAPCVPVS